MFNGLYDVWNDAKKRGAITAWPSIKEFIAWARESGYKAEYGYKGEFSPDNLTLAIPKAVKQDADSLADLKLIELKEIAADLEIDIKGVTTKKGIAALITEARNGQD